MPKALVIGSEGNIGDPLTAHLREEGYEVSEVDLEPQWRDGYRMADINHPLDLLPAFDEDPDVVFMLAAMVSRVTSEQAGSLTVATNLAGLNNVVQLCKRADAKLVFFSTSEVYGPGQGRMHEDETDPEPNNRYGLSKLLGEQLVEYEVAHHDLSAVTLRPFMVYDEEEAFGDHRSAMIRFATDLARGESVEVHEGTARGWLHVDDAVRAFERAGRLDDYHVLNVGNPNVVPIEDLVEMIREELGAPRKLLTFTEQPDQMTPVKDPALDKQRRLLDFEPRVDLEEGVRRVCEAVRARLRT